MRTAVLLSGGVDSSVALALLHDSQGHELTAFYLKIWLEEELSFLGDCPWEEDLKYARATCRQLDIPLEIVPLQTEYLERVVDPALSELRSGRTPSPDILCNRRIKFGAFLDRIGHQFDQVATGHYARRLHHGDAWTLERSPDPVKDQTYFLSRLRQDQLARALFPLGELTKREVRNLAASWSLSTARRPDSQGICFLGRIRYRDFVRFHLGERQGDIRDVRTGRVLGHHPGHWFFTIGQRFGLGLGGGPWYVVDKVPHDNVLKVTHGNHLEEYSRYSFPITSLHWIGPPPRQDRLLVRVRHGPDLTPCRLIQLTDDVHEVRLDRPDPGLAPGQYAVFYEEQTCLGGGIIAPPDAQAARSLNTLRARPMLSACPEQST